MDSTSDSMLAVTRVLLGDPLPPPGPSPTQDRSTAKTISDVRRVHARHWGCFCAGETPVLGNSTSHRTSNPTTQRKRKRKNSDGEYAPHQKVEDNWSTSEARRTSKRLAAAAQSEKRSSSASTSTQSSRRIYTVRSSSSTSALTSASGSSFHRLSTPNDPDTSDVPPSASEPRQIGRAHV